MLKEKMNNVKIFVKEHKTEIIIVGLSAVTLALLGVEIKRNKCKTLRLGKDVHMLKEVAERRILEMIGRDEFEIEQLVESINNLDKNVAINVNQNIPVRKARINVLTEELNELYADLDKVRSSKA